MANIRDSLSHTKWLCKYHIVFTPKYRRKTIYGQYSELNHVKSYRKKSCESYENLTQNKTSKIRVTGDKKYPSILA